MALEQGRRSPPSKIEKRGKDFKRSQKARIIQARYRPLKPRYVPTNNVPKNLTTKSHHPTKTGSPHALKTSVSTRRKGGRRQSTSTSHSNGHGGMGLLRYLSRP